MDEITLLIRQDKKLLKAVLLCVISVKRPGRCMDIESIPHLNSKHITMTNIDMLHASPLDILFENRNKAYGAYALRTGYTSRMLTAMAAGISVIVLVLTAVQTRGKGQVGNEPVAKTEGMVIREVRMPEQQLPEPEKVKEIPAAKKPEKIATVKYVSTIAIKPDVKTDMAAIDDMEGKAIAEISGEGKPAVGTEVEMVQPDAGTGTAIAAPEQPEFTVQERSPEFPGGAEALRKFLARNLVSPDNLDEGEIKTVRIRFRVEKDGAVRTFEILTSGGENFDGEVVRVCRKMPKWVPALQNGVHIPVDYVLPVTFVGSE